jgi:hypothetical protein
MHFSEFSVRSLLGISEPCPATYWGAFLNITLSASTSVAAAHLASIIRRHRSSPLSGVKRWPLLRLEVCSTLALGQQHS